MLRINCVVFGVILLAGSLPASAWERPGPSGSTSAAVGPNKGVAASGTRSVNGNRANSEFSVTGKRGGGVTGAGSSTVTGNSVSGQAHVETTSGHAADLKGQLKKQGNSVTGSGSVTTSQGRSLYGQGSAAMTEAGYQANVTVTTGQGIGADVSAAGTSQAGTVSVATDQGSKSRDYDRSVPKRSP